MGFLSWNKSFIVQIFSRSWFCETVFGFKFLVFASGPREIFVYVIQSKDTREEIKVNLTFLKWKIMVFLFQLAMLLKN